MNNHFAIDLLHSDHLCHHGVMGMHWGVRRYQPYPTGYTGKGVFLGKLKGAYGVAKARSYATDANWHSRNKGISKAKKQYKEGKITKEEYKNKKRMYNEKLKDENEYVRSRAFKRRVLAEAKNGDVKSIYEKYKNYAESNNKGYTAKRAAKLANAVITAAEYSTLPASVVSAGISTAALFSIVPPAALLIPATALAPAIGLHALRKVSRRTRGAVMNRVQ